MKLGILGTGMIVKSLMKTIEQLNLEKIYLLGTEETKEETYALANMYALDKCFFDYDALLNSDVDTIYVALPNHLHYQFAKKALEKHKHIIIEKPITTHVNELSALLELAQKNGKIILEAMNIHYLPAYKALKKHLSKLGDIKIISLNYSQYSSRYDKFKEGIILPAFDSKKAGGALMDINVYNLHFIVGLFGKPKAIHYLANIQRDIDTSGILTLHYDKFQAVCIGAKDCSAPIFSTIQGEQGSFLITKPVNQIESYSFQKKKEEVEKFDYQEGHHRLYYEFKAFIDIIDHEDMQKASEMIQISKTVTELIQVIKNEKEVAYEYE